MTVRTICDYCGKGTLQARPHYTVTGTVPNPAQNPMLDPALFGDFVWTNSDSMTEGTWHLCSDYCMAGFWARAVGRRERDHALLQAVDRDERAR